VLGLSQKASVKWRVAIVFNNYLGRESGKGSINSPETSQLTFKNRLGNLRLTKACFRRKLIVK